MPARNFQKPRQADFLRTCETCQFGCCNGVRPPLTWKRKRMIQNFLKANGIHTSEPFNNGEYVYPRETQEGYCIFFDKASKKCRIHPVKPETCVAGPITFDINRETGMIEWFLKIEKVCPLSGALNRDKESLEKHVKTAKGEVLRLVQDLDSEALKAILTIKEPDTFKLGEDTLYPKVVAKLKP